MSFVHAHKEDLGVEPVCSVLSDLGWHIAPSTYYAAMSRPLSARRVEDERLKKLITEIREDNYDVYGIMKMWHALNRAGYEVGRDRAARLMSEMGLEGVVRGRAVRTTVRDDAAERAEDLVKRQFVAGAPDRLWVADFTHVPTAMAVVYIAFIIDAFSRRIVSWEASMSKEVTFVLSALQVAVDERQPGWTGAGERLIHHSDAGSQYTAFKFTEHISDAGIVPSIGTVGDALDNALAESTIGLYKTELIKPRGPWYSIDDVEFATSLWVDWYNGQRLHSACGYRPPAEYEALYHSGDLTSLVTHPK